MDNVSSGNGSSQPAGLPNGENKTTGVIGVLQGKEVATSSMGNARSNSSNYFTEIIPFEMRNNIFSYAVDESLVALSRTNVLLSEAVKAFMGKMLKGNYDPENFFVPFKNRFADFKNSNIGIAITYCFYTLRHLDEPSCVRYHQLFTNYFYCWVNSWIEDGFIIDKYDAGYDLTINGAVVRLSEKDNVSLYLLCLLLPRYISSIAAPHTLASMEGEPLNEFNPFLGAKGKLLLSILDFGERHKFEEKFLPNDINILIDLWSAGGFIFKKFDDGFHFIINNKANLLNESSDGFIFCILQFLTRYFLSRKIISDNASEEGSKKILDSIDFFVRHKSKPLISNTISRLLVHFYDQCHSDADQRFWTQILDEFVGRALVDADQALVFKDYALTKLAIPSCPWQVYQNAMHLLISLLMKNLVQIGVNEAKFFKDFAFEKFSDSDSTVELQDTAIFLLNQFLERDLVQLDAVDGAFLKVFLIKTLKNPFNTLQFQINPIGLLTGLLIRGLLKIDVDDEAFLKNYGIQKLSDPLSPLGFQGTIILLLGMLLQMNSSMSIDPNAVGIIKNNVIEKFKDLSLPFHIHFFALRIITHLLIFKGVLIDPNEAKVLKDFTLMKLQDTSAPLELREAATFLLDFLLHLHLVEEANAHDTIFLKAHLIGKLKDKSVAPQIQLNAVDAFNHLLIKNILKINGEEAKFLKDYVIEKLRAPSSSLALLKCATSLLDELLAKNLVEENPNEDPFLKNYVIGKLKDPLSSWSTQQNAVCALNILLIRNLRKLDVDEVRFLKAYLIATFRKPPSLLSFQQNALCVFTNLLKLNLMKVDDEDSEFLKDYAIVKLNDPLSCSSIQRSAIYVLNNLLISNLLKINADDGVRLKACLIEKLRNISCSLDVQGDVTRILNSLLIINLVKVDSDEVEFLMNYAIEKLGDSTLPLSFKEGLAILLKTFTDLFFSQQVAK